MKSKLCRGPSHRAPTWVPLIEENWNFYRTGPRAGMAYAVCKKCRGVNYRMNGSAPGPHGLVGVNPELLRLISELISRCGSAYQVEHVYGISSRTLALITKGKTVMVQKRTAQRILIALTEQRKQDRRNGRASRYTEQLRVNAEREAHMTARREREYGL